MADAPKTISIGIREVKFLQFETTTRVQEIRKQLPHSVYEFQFDLNSDIRAEEKLFILLLSITLYERQSPETKVELANLKVQMSFDLVNFDEMIQSENKATLVPDQLVVITAGMITSTARGMFAYLVKDSIVNNAVIPVINAQSFLPRKQETLIA